MQKSVLKIQKLGAPPEGYEAGKPLDKKAFRIWDEWIEAVQLIQKPITWEEAEVLIRCCPTDHMSGIEWTFLKLLHNSKIYLGYQLEKPNSDRCYGLVADDDYLLVCEYGCNGAEPEIILYKKR